MCGIPTLVTWCIPRYQVLDTSVQGTQGGGTGVCSEALFSILDTFLSSGFPKVSFDHNCISGPFCSQKGRRVGTLGSGSWSHPRSLRLPTAQEPSTSENLHPLSEKAELGTGGVGRLLESLHVQITGCPSMLKNVPEETLKGLSPGTSDPRVHNEPRVVVGRWRRATAWA